MLMQGFLSARFDTVRRNSFYVPNSTRLKVGEQSPSTALGAVLHDLIMRRPLFEEFSEPFAMLVEAVKSESPEIYTDDVPADLILLAQNCLVKPPEARLTLVSWNDFEQPPFGTRRSADSPKERVRKRTLLTRSQSGETASSQLPPAKQIAGLITGRLDNIIRNECIGSNSCPPLQIIQDTEGQTRVTVIFAPSPDRALPQQLSIRFDCELVDEATMALRIVASACLLRNDVTHGDPPAPANVFRGPLGSTNLAVQIQNLLWCAIDLAQRQGALSASGDDAFWLNLGQEFEGRR